MIFHMFSLKCSKNILTIVNKLRNKETFIVKIGRVTSSHNDSSFKIKLYQITIDTLPLIKRPKQE